MHRKRAQRRPKLERMRKKVCKSKLSFAKKVAKWGKLGGPPLAGRPLRGRRGRGKILKSDEARLSPSSPELGRARPSLLIHSLEWGCQHPRDENSLRGTRLACPRLFSVRTSVRPSVRPSVRTCVPGAHFEHYFPEVVPESIFVENAKGVSY